MQARVKLAALRILAIREEFNNAELRDALSLAEHLSNSFGLELSRRAKKEHTGRANRGLADSESRAVANLRDCDPDRYSILSKIDRSVRLGIMFPRLSDIRRAGCSLDKEFASGRSKKDAIPRLMEKLAELSISELERKYGDWNVESDDKTGEREYDDLAEFLIRGTRSSVSAH